MDITLVRHGQAQSGATDEASYDNLSDLGRQQAGWLGQYLLGTDHGVSAVVCGTLNRQRDTASEIGDAIGIAPQQDARLNEINYFALAASLNENQGVPLPQGRDDFLAHLPRVMSAWQAGQISCPDESFADFEARVGSLLEMAEQRPGTMLVTSGGIIGMAIRLIMGLDTAGFSHVLLQTYNASFHKYRVEAGARRIVTFNATPHLDAKERAQYRTYL